MINIYKNCSLAISDNLNNMGIDKIFLPEDICLSVISSLKDFNISYEFYEVERGWGTEDTYKFEKIPADALLLISDLFNFRGINYEMLKCKRVVLDLAHCSIETLHECLDNSILYGIEVLFSCISMGKGKYYRYGGGGVVLINNEANREINFPNVEYVENEKLKSFTFLSNDYSTRMVIKSSEISSDEVKRLRCDGVPISDGLFSHLKNEKSKEYYVWKDIVL